jgi:hypothetical protein
LQKRPLEQEPPPFEPSISRTKPPLGQWSKTCFVVFHATAAYAVKTLLLKAWCAQLAAQISELKACFDNTAAFSKTTPPQKKGFVSSFSLVQHFFVMKRYVSASIIWELLDTLYYCKLLHDMHPTQTQSSFFIIIL